jgi:alpha-tubulin suppressor-like RCC1 family protein
VTAGYGHSCALDSADQPFCWGSNGAGELGVAFASRPGEPGSTTPAAVHNATAGFFTIDAGFEFTCATRTDGTGWCWGRGHEGQLGTGGYGSWVVAQPVANVGDFAAIDVGAGAHACGTTASSAILCWGRGDVGQLGVRSVTESAAPVRVPGVEQ